MRIALIGATGFVRSAILKEALSRGYQVLATVAGSITMTSVKFV
jgi:putative NADH-flavin reductase